MRAKNVRLVVDLEELFDDLSAECVTCPARRKREFVSVGIRVGPDKVSHRAFVGDFAESVDYFDLVDGVDGGGETWWQMALVGIRDIGVEMEANLHEHRRYRC